MKELKKGASIVITDTNLSEIPVSATIIDYKTIQKESNIYQIICIVYFEHYLVKVSREVLLDDKGEERLSSPYTLIEVISSSVYL